jgi:hypothetical protein
MKHLLIAVPAVLFSALGLEAQEPARLHAVRTPTVEAVSSAALAIWQPPLQSSWQWQLTTPVDQTVKADVFDIDVFDNSAKVVASLHAKGKKVICSVNVGNWENWRSDASKFPSIVLGKDNSWAGEKWLDIRRLDILGPLMEARLDVCKAKGFDGVEPDNVDGYINDTGFPLTYMDQLSYNIFIAKAAHARGLSVGLKNDLDQIQDLLPYFDWALNEECFQYKECTLLAPFISAGKAVFEVEYRLDTTKFCPTANAMNFNSMKKKLSLNAYRVPCR